MIKLKRLPEKNIQLREIHKINTDVKYLVDSKEYYGGLIKVENDLLFFPFISPFGNVTTKGLTNWVVTPESNWKISYGE